MTRGLKGQPCWTGPKQTSRRWESKACANRRLHQHCRLRVSVRRSKFSPRWYMHDIGDQALGAGLDWHGSIPYPTAVSPPPPPPPPLPPSFPPPPSLPPYICVYGILCDVHGCSEASMTRWVEAKGTSRTKHRLLEDDLRLFSICAYWPRVQPGGFHVNIINRVDIKRLGRDAFFFCVSVAFVWFSARDRGPRKAYSPPPPRAPAVPGQEC